jgi:hypothetical protein
MSNGRVESPQLKAKETVEIEYSADDVLRILEMYSAGLYGRSGYTKFYLEKPFDKFVSSAGQESYSLKLRSTKSINPPAQVVKLEAAK